jgi:hypothetical protein
MAVTATATQRVQQVRALLALLHRKAVLLLDMQSGRTVCHTALLLQQLTEQSAGCPATNIRQRAW